MIVRYSIYKRLSFYGIIKVLVVKCNNNKLVHITVCEDGGMFLM